jgi:gliding motility-associated-like protein
VVDTQNPVITCPDELVLYAGASECYLTNLELPQPQVSDNCAIGNVVVAAPDAFPVGTTSITWTVTDASGNSASCEQLVVVIDNIAPVVYGCGEIVEFGTDLNQCGAIVNYDTLLVTDNCDLMSVVQLSGPASGEFLEVGEHEVTYQFTDVNGNATVCSWIISVVDTQEPVLVCPESIFAESDAVQCGLVVNYIEPGVLDNCPTNNIEGVLVSGLESGSIFPVGITVVEYTLTDGSGNTTNCTFDVNITDTTEPEIVCPENISLNDPELDGVVVNYDLPEVTDNCGALINVIEGPESGDVFVHGNTTVVFEAVDNAGLTDTCSFNVLVNNPPIALNDSIIFEDAWESTQLLVLLNDSDPDGDEITIVSAEAQNGSIQVQPSGVIVYTIDPSVFCGDDTLIYVIQDTYFALDTAIMVVHVECPFTVSVPEVFTPNGDGVNDVFEIRGIEDYPDHDLKIFNKRGHKVFENSGGLVSWNGRSTSVLDFGNGQLPEDTYYYVLDLGDGSDLIKGYVYITY